MRCKLRNRVILGLVEALTTKMYKKVNFILYTIPLLMSTNASEIESRTMSYIFLIML